MKPPPENPGRFRLPDGAARALAVRHMAMLRKSEDFGEGARAYLEKGERVWTGR